MTTTKITLTYDEAVSLLERAVAEKGADYVYPRAHRLAGCVYFEEETKAPSCIVGHVLAYKGVDPEPFIEDVNLNGDTVDSLLSDDEDPGFVNTDGRTKSLLSWVQHIQDNGKPWGDAVYRARNAVENRAHG